MKDFTRKPDPKTSDKKPYLTPSLQIYGSIVEITQHGGTGGTGDNASKRNSKTGG
jgi:hypothetical protein